LLEVLWSLLLLAVVLQGGWTVLARHRTGGAAVAARAEALETVRTIGWLLPEELAGGRAGTDWSGAGTDSLRVRAFRGVALPDPKEPGEGLALNQWKVCFRGLRSPNPEKDSILALGVDGRWRLFSLSRRRRGDDSCPGPGSVTPEDWFVDPPPDTPLILGRLFEAGSYYLVNGALRYRRGEGGRQPLTPLRLSEGFFPDRGEGSVSWEATLTQVSAQADPSIWRGRVRR